MSGIYGLCFLGGMIWGTALPWLARRFSAKKFRMYPAHLWLKEDGTLKNFAGTAGGYYWHMLEMPSGRICISVAPQRGADDPKSDEVKFAWYEPLRTEEDF